MRGTDHCACKGLMIIMMEGIDTDKECQGKYSNAEKTLKELVSGSQILEVIR